MIFSFKAYNHANQDKDKETISQNTSKPQFIKFSKDAHRKYHDTLKFIK